MISRKKSRRATLDGIAYRYKISTTPRSEGIYQLNITIQIESHNGGKLVVTGLEVRDNNVFSLVGCNREHM